MSNQRGGAQPSKFRFKRDITVGSIEAETDKQALREAFIDTGDLDTLLDTENPRSVVVGRTGTGKSALLLMLQEREERVLRIDPASLAMRYLTNSTILPYLARLEVRLTPFYQLLWKHVLVTEVLRHHYHLDDATAQNNWFQRLSFKRDSERKKQTLNYYRSFNPAFWQTMDVRVKEITDKVAENIEASLGREKLAAVKAGESLESTTRKEVTQRAQEVVNQISLEQIHRGFDLLREEVLTDDQKRYFIVIDDLDKDWIELADSYELIDALLDSVARLAQLDNIKVVVALRENIVAALHRRRHVQAQQREKQRNLFLRLQWSSADLVRLLDERVRALIHGHYGGPISLDELLPAPTKKEQRVARDWMIERTFKRPRDLISFMNAVLTVAAEHGKKTLSWETLYEAERRYSPTMRDNVEDEWRTNYGGLRTVFDAFHRITDNFTIDDLEDLRLDGILAEGRMLSESGSRDGTSLPLIAWNIICQRTEARGVWQMLLLDLFRVSFVGVRLGPSEPIVFSYDRPDIVLDEAPVDARWFIHPAFYEVLKVQGRTKG